MMYTHNHVVIFCGLWVATSVRDNVSIKRDAYGFWLADFRRRQRVDFQLYVFPGHVKSVLLGGSRGA